MKRLLALGAAAVLALSTAPAASAAPAPTIIQPGTSATCQVDPRFEKHEMRGLWIASVVNIDWPSKPGLTAAQQQAELDRYLDLAKTNGYNAVILQVRPTADAFWPSEHEPWSQYLTGTQGVDPGWDPLGYAVGAAHGRGLELHAWMNPYRVAMDEAGKSLLPTHPAKVHPEWTIPYGGKLYYNPGMPEVREHVVASMLDAVEKYDIDAVHFDDYFYPYPVAGKVFDDSAAYAQYGNGMSLADWRRANTDTLIDEMREGIRAIRPGTQFGVSPFGVWRNVATDPTGSLTTAGAQTYDDLYADTRKWTLNGQVDYMLPQAYWSKTLAAASYVNVTDWWAAVAAQSPNTNVYLGEGTYKIGANADPAWNDPREMASHLDYVDQVNAKYGHDVIKGHVYYNANTTAKNLLDGMGIVSGEYYSKPALTPTMPWLDATAPASPRVTRVDGTLTINGPADANQYVIYRVEKKAKNVTSCDIADTRNVVAIVNGDTTTWTDPEITGRFGHYTYLVSAVDEGSNESAAFVVR